MLFFSTKWQLDQPQSDPIKHSRQLSFYSIYIKRFHSALANKHRNTIFHIPDSNILSIFILLLLPGKKFLNITFKRPLSILFFVQWFPIISDQFYWKVQKLPSPLNLIILVNNLFRQSQLKNRLKFLKTRYPSRKILPLLLVSSLLKLITIISWMTFLVLISNILFTQRPNQFPCLKCRIVKRSENSLSSRSEYTYRKISVCSIFPWVQLAACYSLPCSQ